MYIGGLRELEGGLALFFLLRVTSFHEPTCWGRSTQYPQKPPTVHTGTQRNSEDETHWNRYTHPIRAIYSSSAAILLSTFTHARTHTRTRTTL